MGEVEALAGSEWHLAWTADYLTSCRARSLEGSYARTKESWRLNSHGAHSNNGYFTHITIYKGLIRLCSTYNAPLTWHSGKSQTGSVAHENGLKPNGANKSVDVDHGLFDEQQGTHPGDGVIVVEQRDTIHHTFSTFIRQVFLHFTAANLEIVAAAKVRGNAWPSWLPHSLGVDPSPSPSKFNADPHTHRAYQSTMISASLCVRSHQVPKSRMCPSCSSLGILVKHSQPASNPQGCL